MNVEIWSIGKESEGFVKDGIQLYLKRIKPFCNPKFVEISPPKRSGNTTIEQSKILEEKLIMDKLQSTHFMILLDEKGKQYTSLEWSEHIQEFMNRGIKTLVFLIGGPWGVTDNIRQMAQKIWSLSSLTFPHQFVRLIMAEQLYRSFSILNNLPYHHE